MLALHSKKKYWLLFIITTATIFLDQFIKVLVVSRIPVYRSITVIPGFFEVTHIYNPGVAFGFLAENNTNLRLIFILSASLIAMGMIIYLFIITKHDKLYLLSGLSLILGGASGNVIDRIRLGKVIDYLDFCIKSLHWPAFNIADSAITIGLLIFIYHLLFKKIFK